MTVCVAEKPSVAAEIAKVLGATKRQKGYFEGNGYQVTWVYGHLCSLKSPDEYYPQWKKWSLGVLPMVPPQYEIRLIEDKGVREQYNIIKTLYKKATTIINCGDAGQEGELIQRWVMKLAGVKCPVKRLWISSLTEEAIRAGFRNLQPQSKYDTLFEAGEARADGDWLLGMNASRLYTIKYAGHGQVLSIGRVQTPTLAMIVNRDLEIENFRPEPYWVLNTLYRGVTFTSTKGKLPSEQYGTEMMNAILGKPFTVKFIQEKQGREAAGQLYDLTSLQVDCNKKYGLSADLTLKTIQSLYEKKFTTYPRVDTKFLTDDIYKKCPEVLASLAGYEQYTKMLSGITLPKPKKVFDDSKVTDHHAIIPTGQQSGTLTDLEKKVYDLICRRFIAVFFPDCQFATTIVMGNVGTVEFKATGKTIHNPGWRVLYQKVQSEEEEDKDKDENQTLPRFMQGETGPHKPTLQNKMTTPPSRYTEATLLQSMETAGKFVEDETLREAMKENGIGRPSSRAGIIETLLKRGYIERQKKNLISTSTGRELMGVIKARLLKSPELTGRWEKKLRDIEAGRYSREQFMQELEHQLRDIIAEVTADTEVRRITSQALPQTTYKGSRGGRYKK